MVGTVSELESHEGVKADVHCLFCAGCAQLLLRVSVLGGGNILQFPQFLSDRTCLPRPKDGLSIECDNSYLFGS